MPTFDTITNLNYQVSAFDLEMVEEEFELVMAAEQGLPGRNSTQDIIVSPEYPSGGQDGDIWFKINV